MKRFLPILLLIGACRSGSHQSGPQDASSRIIQAALAENQGYEKLVWLCDRVVLFTNEENGLRGANAYRDTHRWELANMPGRLGE